MPIGLPMFKNVVLLALVLGLPIAFYVGVPLLPSLNAIPSAKSPVQISFPPSSLPFQFSVLGRAPAHKPMITNVKIFDLDRDGLPDVLVCDATINRVIWYRQIPKGNFEEHILGEVDLAAPCHVTPVDLDGDGHLDLVVAVLGSAFPTDDPVGKVVWLKNDGKQNFTTHVLLDDLRRVADVQAGDVSAAGQDRRPVFVYR